MNTSWSFYGKKQLHKDVLLERLEENLRSKERYLDLSNCNITELPEGLISHHWLYYLNISKNPITSLALPAGLPYLKALFAQQTLVSDVEPLSDLKCIELLELSDTKVTDLSPLIKMIENGLAVSLNMRRLENKGLFLAGSPLTHPPTEIVKQGKNAILNYLGEMKSGKDRLYEAKVLIVGEGDAGKTSLLTRLYKPNDPLPMTRETTRGISIHRHHFTSHNGRDFRLNVWDFAGQEILTATHQFFLTRRSLYVLVDSTRQNAKSVSDKGFKDWLEMVDVISGHSPVLIFQNEVGDRSKAIDLAGIKGQWDNVKELHAGNLEHPQAADKIRTAIEYYSSTLPHIGEELPARWIKVRADIETRAKKVPYITQQDYFEIYARHLDFDRVRALHLSRYLHDLGVFLHFQDDPLLCRSVILQNQWATDAVFRLLEDERIKEKGRFKQEDYQRLWHDPAYGDMHPELLALMKNFELCYELRDENTPTWLIPQLLSPEKPKQPFEWRQRGDTVVQYKYDFLPKGLISRLIVRLHRYVSRPAMAWWTGALFESETTNVLVELLSDGSSIELRARGPERRALLNVVTADLDALNDSFQGLRNKVNKLISCNCELCLDEINPYLFRHKELLRRKDFIVAAGNSEKLNQRVTKVQCELSWELVDVLELLQGVRNEPGRQASPSVRRDIRVFLASSSELREERDALDLHLRQRNDLLRKSGLYLEIVRWENFLDAMSETRLQDEYNKAIRECDLFVCLFFTKTGKYSAEEFDVAHRQFKASGRPRIFVYFKNAGIRIGQIRKEEQNSLWAFRDKLNALGHFPKDFDNVEHLILDFSGQLDKVILN
jgi:internalin A